MNTAQKLIDEMTARVENARERKEKADHQRATCQVGGCNGCLEEAEEAFHELYRAESEQQWMLSVLN